MELVLLLILITLLTFLAYKLFIKPVRLKAHYSQLFKKMGFKVYQKPYRVHTVPFYDDFFQDEVKYGNYGYRGMTQLATNNYDIYLSNVMNSPVIFFMNEKFIDQFLNKQDKCTKITVNYDILRYIIQKSLGFIEKEEWKHRRKLISKVFKFDTINNQIPQMVQVANQMFEKYQNKYWANHPEAKQQRKIQLNLYQLLTNFAAAIVMTGFLGLNSMNEVSKGQPLYVQIQNLQSLSTYQSRDPLIKMFGLSFFKLGLRKADRDIIQRNGSINKILLSYINRYRDQIKKGDEKVKNQEKNIVQLILQEIEKQKQEHGAIEMTDQDLIDEIKAFVMGGTDTVSNYLTILILNLYQQKDSLQKLKKQINEFIKSDQDITGENLNKITYLKSVLTETSRMYPMIEFMFEREADEDIVINGVPIVKGTTLNYYSKPLLFNKDLFPQPHQFKPQRWQEQSEQNKHLHRLVSLQFSGGQRSCVGKLLAIAEARVILVKFLRRYESLIEPTVDKRVIKMQIVGHVEKSDIQLVRSY